VWTLRGLFTLKKRKGHYHEEIQRQETTKKMLDNNSTNDVVYDITPFSDKIFGQIELVKTPDIKYIEWEVDEYIPPKNVK
jgi:hypothetical protein